MNIYDPEPELNCTIPFAYLHEHLAAFQKPVFYLSVNFLIMVCRLPQTTVQTFTSYPLSHTNLVPLCNQAQPHVKALHEHSGHQFHRATPYIFLVFLRGTVQTIYPKSC